jgi:Fe2+ or Zn2+ uptake regulation protein
MLREEIFLSPEELREKLQRRGGSAGLPTVYRNLEELAGVGVLTKILHPNRQLYYYFCPNRSHHHHFVCLDCRTVADIDFCGCAEMARQVGGEVFSHFVQALGRCRRCAGTVTGASA